MFERHKERKAAKKADADIAGNGTVYAGDVDDNSYQTQFDQPIIKPNEKNPDHEVYPISAVKSRHVTATPFSQPKLEGANQDFRKDETEHIFVKKESFYIRAKEFAHNIRYHENAKTGKGDIPFKELAKQSRLAKANNQTTDQKEPQYNENPVEINLSAADAKRRERHIEIKRHPEIKKAIACGTVATLMVVGAYLLYRTHQKWMIETAYDIYKDVKGTSIDRTDPDNPNSPIKSHRFVENPRGGGEGVQKLYSPNSENIPDNAIIGEVTENETNVQGLETVKVEIEKNNEMFKNNQGKTITLKYYNPNGTDIERKHTDASLGALYGSYGLGFGALIPGYPAAKIWWDYKQMKKQEKKENLPQKAKPKK
jgi:hypothetical protein